MIVSDHLNLMGVHPLLGPNDDALGTRFPDMTNAYDATLRAQLLERRSEVLFLLSPALLAVAMKLEAAGIDLETALAGADIVRKHMARTANDLVDLFVKRAKEGAIETTDAAEMFQALRPTGLEAVRVIFGREMERALRKLLESGKIATLPAKVKRPKKRS